MVAHDVVARGQSADRERRRGCTRSNAVGNSHPAQPRVNKKRKKERNLTKRKRFPVPKRIFRPTRPRDSSNSPSATSTDSLVYRQRRLRPSLAFPFIFSVSLSLSFNVLVPRRFLLAQGVRFFKYFFSPPTLVDYAMESYRTEFKDTCANDCQRSMKSVRQKSRDAKAR